MIEILPEERWGELKETFDKVFDCHLPNRGGAQIIADVEDGEIKCFLVVEIVAKVGQIWSNGTSSPRKLFKFVEKGMKPESSVVVVSDEPRFDGLCKKLGMYETGKMFRRDF